MSNYKKAAQKTDIILNVLTYASENKLNVSDRGDVKKILDALGIHYLVSEFDEFMNLLQDADTFTDILEKKRNRLEKKLSN